METKPLSSPTTQDDLLLAFDMAPVGLLISRNRYVQSCNRVFSNMFGYLSEALKGKSLLSLYPSVTEFEHIGDRALMVMRNEGRYSDDRIMKRNNGQLFWCHVSGRPLTGTSRFLLQYGCLRIFQKKGKSRLN
ncbi:PAS domain-containing protein [Advenella sp. RU8]|uniref:PAS domain-containing protein n=1 Tax=Advenella sp. RU8 TaxID=3399575 RepID=UPI003AAC107C